MKNIFIIEQKIICDNLTEVAGRTGISYNTLTHAFSRNKLDSSYFNGGTIFIEKMSIKRLCDIVEKIKVIDYKNFDLESLKKSLLFILKTIK